MPMWIRWENPETGKNERIYNYCDVDDPDGQVAMRVARTALGQKFRTDPEDIPGFFAEAAPYLPTPCRNKVLPGCRGREVTVSSIPHETREPALAAHGSQRFVDSP